MSNNDQLQFVKDVPGKQVMVTRQYNATVERVWKAWTESESLDQWWAPKPWRAETKSMDFKVGGYWLYAMVGPDGTKQWCKVEYKAIDPQKSYQAVDMFCDENGNRTPDFPGMRWKNVFQATATGTTVIIEINFNTEEDMQKILEMGFEAGFTMGLGNLEELLAK